MSFSSGYFDSEDVMNWLLLNPEMAEFDNHLVPALGSSSSNHSMDNFNFMSSSHDFFDIHDPRDPHASYRPNSADPEEEDRKARYREKYIKTGKKREREVEDIEAKIAKLKAENADLQAHVLNVAQRTTEIQRQRAEMEKEMQAKLEAMANDDNADQTELADVVKKFTDIYADYGRCRQKEVAFHVNQLEKLILPTRTTKMCLWALQQNDSFFQSNQSPIFDILSKELEITSDQTEKIQDRRERIKHLLGQLNENLTLLNTFKSAIEKKHSSYDRICGRVQDIATPKQIVLFLLWLKKNAENLSRFIPNYSRNIHHTPNVAFIDGAAVPPPAGLIPGLTSSAGSSSSSSSSNSSGGGVVNASLTIP